MAKQKNDKIVKVTCKGAGELAMSLLTPLQGNLKSLPDENYRKLKAEIELDGFIEPVSVWEDPESGKVFILNGHQRVATLHRMSDDGWSIPQVPVNYVEATDLRDAKRKILAMASQFGVVDKQAVFEFAAELDLSALDVATNFQFADFNMDEFVKQFSDAPYLSTTVLDGETVPVSAHERLKPLENSSKEMDLNDFQKFKHECPKCGFGWDESNGAS